MKAKKFRRQKTLYEVAMRLRALGKDVDGSSGLERISAALAEHRGCEAPVTKEGRWAYIAEFIGCPADFWPMQKVAREPPMERKRDAPDFYKSEAWMALRYVVLRERGAACECCGATRADGVVIQVDHVKPRSLFPELALRKDNLQVLCRPCNLGKSNRDATDWRDGASLQ